MLTIADIREIIKMVDQSSIQQFQLEQGATKISIGKNTLVGPTPKITNEVDSYETNEKEVSINATIPGQIAEEIIIQDGQKEFYKITAPMIGTFYASPEPGAAEFVKIGEKIKPNTVVCVLEVMKLFNEVEAQVTGEIVEILVKDGEFVEYGQPLFVVKIG